MAGRVVEARHAGRATKSNGRGRGATSSPTSLGLFDYPRVASRLFNRPLLISRAKLDAILSVLVPRLAGGGPPPPPPAELIVSDPTFREFEVLEGGVAIIPVCGSLLHSAKGGPDPESGLTSYPMIRRWFDDAMDDPEVSAIVLDVDSPGGEAAGVFDLAAHIRTNRGRKPVVAVSDEMAFSAAYAIASQAERVFVPRLGGVGSVGVIAVHVDQSRYDAAQGLKYTAVYAGERKNDFTPHAPLSSEALEILQAEIESVYDVFVREVAAGRGIGEARVRATEAALFFGDDTIAAGFADEVATVDAAIEAARSMAANRRRSIVTAPARSAAKENTMPRGKRTETDPNPADEPRNDPNPNPNPNPSEPTETGPGEGEGGERRDPESQGAEGREAARQSAEVIDLEERRAEIESGARKKAAAEWAKAEAALRTRLEAVKRLDLFADLAPIAREKGVEAAVSALFDRLASGSGPEIVSVVNPLGTGEKNPLMAAIERRNAEDAERRKAAR